MPCYFPLNAYKAKSKDSGKISIVWSRPQSWKGDVLKLPCGQCIGCRLESSRQWSVRCMHEASLYDENCFLTLTYSPEFLPSDLSLNKSHFQLFMKRLRKRFGSGIRYFQCGEYGERFARPHYHALLFNFNFSDRKYFKGEGDKRLFTSDTLSELWPMGHSLIGAVTFESSAYVARYILKKVTGPGKESHYGGRTPEYITMSRGSKRIGTGGIGKGWYDRFKGDIYPLDRCVVRGHDSRPPRFYDTLFSREDRSAFELMKIAREKNGHHFVTDVLSDGTVISESDSSSRRLAVKEVVKQAEISNLRRMVE